MQLYAKTALLLIKLIRRVNVNVVQATIRREGVVSLVGRLGVCSAHLQVLASLVIQLMGLN